MDTFRGWLATQDTHIQQLRAQQTVVLVGFAVASQARQGQARRIPLQMFAQHFTDPTLLHLARQ